MPARSSLRGNFLGPLTASVVNLPIEANYGIIALAPLGPQYMAIGVLAALYCAIFSNLAGLLTRSRTGLLGGTRPTLAIAIAVLVADLAGRLRTGDGPDVPLVLTFTLLTVMMAGGIQILMSLLRVGRVIKYLPYPVLAGYVNGAALLIFMSALRPFIGLPNAPALTGFLADLATVQPVTLAVSCVTAGVALSAPRFAPRIPPFLAGMLAGVFFYHLLVWFFEPEALGGVLVAVTPRAPDLGTLNGFVRIFQDAELRALIPSLLPAALTLALLATVESLLTASVIDSYLPGRQSANRELLSQGVANTLSACFGGLPSAAGVARCTNNVRAGASTRLATLIYVLIVCVILASAQLISFLPLAMMGGIMMAAAWTMVDDWSRRVPRQLITRHGLTRAQHRTLLANYLVMLVVVATTALSNLVTAVFVGVLAAMLLFVSQNSRNIIRRQLSGAHHHSLRQRSISRMQELEREGGRIVLLELEGALFFGTADKLGREIERLARHADYLIIDFRRITDIDITGARILQQAAREAAAKRCQLLLAAIDPAGGRGRILLAAGSNQSLDRRYWFDAADTALEWAEDALLDKFDLPEQLDRHLGIEETQLGRGLSLEERDVLRAGVEEISITREQPLFRCGDAADGLFVVVAGSVSVTLNSAHGRRRIASFAPGTILGEMGLLDGLPRSADVFADGTAIVLKLGRESFERIRAAHPGLAAKILFNLSVEMATRLRYTNQELQLGEAVRLDS